ncbi:putative tricarboxylic transport membrane protein [Pseudorhodobacter antarcticus]|jgi:putative tricarboxylic transport membrane protein|uniref:Putative tricarboxylic transport membrane protein n=1 Tax=Pseudorhodobacter antarcticus TaxID=1077947 RepID=A0A1H8H0T2_9RHOB|nr:tripartite tricarboxylate transporter TctB family protein [Pseudorhodobacter antarcticus]SEN49367.1 putative tricarboxylic transport membrane protein [Pseudorhodobacter antarcticus]
MRGDRIFGLVMLVLALGYVLSATTIRSSFMSDPVGPRVFPYMVGGVTMLCALMMMLRPDPDVEWPLGKTLLNLTVALAALIAYALMIKPLGFILPTIIVSGILSYQISPRPQIAALTGVGLGIGLFVLFKFILGLGLKGLPPALMG